MKFYTGLHMPSHAKYFDRCFISVNRLLQRKSDFEVTEWAMDSGAFTRITSGIGHMTVEEYADQIRRWSKCGTLSAAVCQDWMCEPFVLELTGFTVGDHQGLTIERYAALKERITETHIMPVLQGFHPTEYAEHIKAYGGLLEHGTWCGVGSVCKRNANPGAVLSVLTAVQRERPDLKIHGFGLKETALKNPLIRKLLYSADSMAWSMAARRSGGDSNDVNEAIAFDERIKTQRQIPLW